MIEAGPRELTPAVSFVHGDFLSSEVDSRGGDWTDADVLFMNSTCFDEEVC